MKTNQAEHAVAMMARLLEASTSGYYAWLARPDSQRTIGDWTLTDRTRHHHEEPRGTHGAHRRGLTGRAQAGRASDAQGRA